MTKTNTTSGTQQLYWSGPGGLGVQLCSVNTPPGNGFFLRASTSNQEPGATSMISCSKATMTAPYFGLKDEPSLLQARTLIYGYFESISSDNLSSRWVRWKNGPVNLNTIPTISVDYNTDGGSVSRTIVNIGS